MQLTTTNQRGFAPATITEAIQFSEMLSKSQMVPRQYQGKPEDIMVAVQWGYEIGLAPLQALQNISVINGKPSVYGDAAMALVQASPVCEGVDEYFENEGTPNPVAVCVARRKGRNPVIARFSVEDAKRAGLWGKQGPWQSYPKRMMQMRARGFALRDAFPDVLKGLITAEEAQDYPTEERIAPAPRKAPANPLDVIAPTSAPTLPPLTPPHVVVPAVTSDPVIIAQAMEDTIEPPPLEEVPLEVLMQQAEEAGLEVVDIPEVVDEPAVAPIGYPLLVPGKTEPVSVHGTLDEWQDAYENMAERTAKATKVPPRERMTKLKDLRKANEEVMNRVDTVKRIRHTANYSQRLAALGAAQ